jgi:Uncharacterized conserved protein
MKIDSKQFRVAEKEDVRLDGRPTALKPLYDSKEEYRDVLAEHVRELSEGQERLYAHDRYSLLVIFQAMDGAGKDSAIKHVMSGVNPQGCRVSSFKHPSAEELDHDFLWRTTRWLPERGQIGIFNRSTTKKFLLFEFIPRFFGVRPFLRNCSTRRRCGISDIVRSWISRVTFIAMGLESLKSSSMFQRTNSGGDFSNALMKRIRTGNSMWTI